MVVDGGGSAEDERARSTDLRTPRERRARGWDRRTPCGGGHDAARHAVCRAVCRAVRAAPSSLTGLVPTL